MERQRPKESIESRNKSDQVIYVTNSKEELEKMLPGLKKLREKEEKENS